MGEERRNERGQYIGYGNTDYKNEEWLRQKYVTEFMPAKQIAHLCRCSMVTILRYVNKFNIPLRRNTLLSNGMWGKKGAESPSWKGGLFTNRQGYRLVYKPLHPCCRQNGYITEHRLVMENFLGRFLKKREHVHHINGKRNDNRIENLALVGAGEHAGEHRRLREDYFRIKKENQGLMVFMALLLSQLHGKGELRLE